jgi:DNA-binding GntR family transcriptional regulator
LGGRTVGETQPQYLRIAGAISERIGRGVYRTGERLPSGAQLAAEFGVSVMTLRQALQVLTDQGFVHAEQGRGTFVRSVDLREATFKLEQLTDRWSDGEAEVRLLSASTKRADEVVARALRIPIGRRTVFLRRLVLKQGRPLIYHTEHVVFDARRPLVETQLQITSLEGLLSPQGNEGVGGGDLTVRAVSLDGEQAALLEVPEGSAGFCLEHLFEDFSGRPVSWGWFLSRADDLTLKTRIGARG